jgi:hypothetical protein
MNSKYEKELIKLTIIKLFFFDLFSVLHLFIFNAWLNFKNLIQSFNLIEKMR